jgi:RecA-family ATPase
MISAPAIGRKHSCSPHGNVVLTQLADAIVERFRDAPPVMVGFDPAISFGAGERIVNDNEQSLVLAARRIVRGLGCCVRLIAHTGRKTRDRGRWINTRLAADRHCRTVPVW